MECPKRLIEVDLPIARISAHARREKSIRHGHISTLHIWWARRPLAACRAVICAALWPDPADDLCPQSFRESAVALIKQFAGRVYPKKITGESKPLRETGSPESLARWEAIAAGTLTLDANKQADMPVLQMCLLDFIADFANWDNSMVPAYLEASRALTQAAHESLGGMAETKPLVVDPFAGGGSIPLEALRVGADAFASDLNPVAVLLNKVVLEYIPKYGKRLADEVRKWGQWVKDQAESELAEFYPKDDDGGTPIAYLWARTILSEAPGQGDEPVEVPLLRSMWLAKRTSPKVALRWRRNDSGIVETEIAEVDYADGSRRRVRRPLLEIFTPKRDSDVEAGTVARGSANCPVTEYTTPAKQVRQQFQKRRGGAHDSRLLAVVRKFDGKAGRDYRLPVAGDEAVVSEARSQISSRFAMPVEGINWLPDETLPYLRSIFNINLLGVTQWGDLFSPRQALAHLTFARAIRNGDFGDDSELAGVIRTLLTLALGKQADLGNSLCAWEPIAQCPRHLFGRQAIGIVWDYAEGVPLGESSGSWTVFIKGIAKALEGIGSDWATGQVQQADAAKHPLPDQCVSLLFTDPPYYDAIPYADLSDFFYVWQKRTLGVSASSHSEDALTPKYDEIVQLAERNTKYAHKTRENFERRMTEALARGREETTHDGVGVFVFAHKGTDAWEAMLQAVIDAGWTATASWPIDTENASRLRAQGAAALGSSVHVVCRPRENRDGSLREEVGEWRDVLAELPQRIHEWMPRLAAEGVVGADAIFACLGPALEIFSRYSRVEKASGEAVPLREYLEQVWAAVSTEALSMIFNLPAGRQGIADPNAAGLEPDARLTAMWLWTLGGGSNGKNGNAEHAAENTEEEEHDGNEDSSLRSSASSALKSGFTLEFDAARKIAQGLGIHLEQSESIVEVKGDKARLLPVSERTRHLFGKDEATATKARGRKKKKEHQRSLFEQLDELEAEAENVVAGELKPQAGETVLDRVHQSMILFASGRGEALRRFLVDDGAGTDARFWKLAQSLSALYPKETDEKRWVDGVLARKKGLGL